MRKVFVMALIFTLLSLPLFAQEPIFEQEYNPLRKLGRGSVNVLFCWLELPYQMIEAGKKTNELGAMSFGFLKGMGYVTARAFIGAYETVTFLFPRYQPLIEPEFILPGEHEM